MGVVSILLRSTLRITGALIVVAAVVVGAFWYFGPSMCGNEVVGRYPSPDGLKQLVVFERDCGATTGFSTQASILPAGKVLKNDQGNVFISDTDHGAAPSGPGGGPHLDAHWQDSRTIVLSYHQLARVFRAVPEANGVRIQYKLQGAAQ